jgi:hypothetical protein
MLPQVYLPGEISYPEVTLNAHSSSIVTMRQSHSHSRTFVIEDVFISHGDCT